MPVCKYCDCGTRTDDYNYKEDKCFLCCDKGKKETVYPVCECGRTIYPNKVHYCDSDVKKVLEKEDIINKPNHYHSGIQPIEAIETNFEELETKGFLKGNVIKYVLRSNKKGKELEDLKKAQWNLNKLIERIEK